MFCPECRAEYREGYTVCSDCKVDLVAELEPEPETEYVELVTLMSTGDKALAAVVEIAQDPNFDRRWRRAKDAEDLRRLILRSKRHRLREG